MLILGSLTIDTDDCEEMIGNKQIGSNKHQFCWNIGCLVIECMPIKDLIYPELFQ